LRVSVFLVCILVLTSCALPNPIVQEPSVASFEPKSTTSTPVSTFETSQSVTPESTSFETQFATPSPQATSVEASLTPTEVVNETTQYDLDTVFDYHQHTLTVTETIRYVNTNPEALFDLILVVEPNRRPGAFRLDSLTWEAGEPIKDYEFEGDQLHIPLPQPLSSDAGVNIVIHYALEIPEFAPPSTTYRPLAYGYSERQTNIVDWYPYIPPYRSGEGWLVHQNWWFGEHQVFDVADYNVRLTLAEPVPDLVIAASAPAKKDGENTYVYHLEAARSFALSASHEYLVQTTTVGDVTVYSYSFPYDEYAGEEALHNTADALELFSQLIIPYPHTSLSVVEADFLESMEYDGLYFLSHGFYNLYEGTPQGYLTFIAAHETAHQWWYGLVGNDQALEPWLDEAMCTYMEHIFYENVYADYPPGSGQSLADWWWVYRVNFFDPDGWVDRAIYDYDQFRPYRDAVYLNGAKFLHDLRNLVGDESFFSFLRDYASQNKNRIATAADFFDILQENTDEDIDGLIDDYFRR
jgi:hypothetical protein